jgi:hypothetical protein
MSSFAEAYDFDRGSFDHEKHRAGSQLMYLVRSNTLGNLIDLADQFMATSNEYNVEKHWSTAYASPKKGPCSG